MTPNPTKLPGTLRPLAEELLDNAHARDNLREGAEKLREVYERAQKPKRTGRKVVLALIGATVVGAGVVLGTNEDLRAKVFGSAKALGDEIAGRDEGGAANDGEASTP